MGDEVPQFDTLLGGTEELPSSISIAKFIACRSQEIQVMKNSLLSQSGTKLAFQTLPKHLRRRAMSHNVKRLPRRLRQVHFNQMKKSGMPTKSKRPSRKYRRRPRNLLEEYTTRSNKKYKWLQTHIWHAKRFHMVEKWGYKLPYYPCDKAFRACYKATTQHCLLQDISYINCIELSGNKNVMIENFKQLTRPNMGLSLGAKAFIKGKHEGELTLFESSTSQKAVGTINFQWQPCSDNDDYSKLWLWVHTAFYNDILRTLVESFHLIINNLDENFFYSNISSGVKLVELAKKFGRFRLTGPLANSILQDVFILLENNSSNLSQSWLNKYLEDCNNKLLIEKQDEYWKQLSNIFSVAEISPHMIVSLIVKDPRLNLPKKRIKCAPSFEKVTVSEVSSSDIAVSPLWEDNLRKEICENKFQTSKILEIKNDLLIPGSDLETNIFVPVILIQRPGNKNENIGLGSGWDVILPATWAKPFWIAMIMRGARAGGLREFNSILFEMGKSQFLHPDTEAGIEEERQISQEYVEKFFRKPPNKRINYNKFNIASPLFWNWKLLIKDWQNEATPVEEFVVLKDKKILNSIDLFLKSKTNLVPDCPRNCLIPVQLECEKRGSPLQFAIICLPKCKNDFKDRIMEPTCIDKNHIERKELREAHQILLKKMRKQNKSTKVTTIGKIKQKLLHKEVLTNYIKKMRALWLPEPTSIRYSCSREIIGFVKKGGFSFSHGKSFATGYIVAAALPALIKTQFRCKILFRNTNTRHYRVAKLSITVE